MMKRTFIFVVVFILLSLGEADAQFSINQTETPSTSKVDPSLVGGVNDRIDNKYFDRAAWLAEKKALRHERNTVEFNAKLQTTMQQFDNWAAGGENTLAAIATIDFRHQYKKEKFQSDLKVNGRFGMNMVDDALYKNADEIKLSEIMSWTMHNNWSYSGSINFRTQFADGYKSRTDSTLVSAFMSPGYLDAAIGFTYNKQGSPFKITLSPISGNMVTVINRELSDQGKYGVEKGKTMLNKIGPSIDIYFDKTFGKKKILRYRSKLYSFTNLETAPTVRWENTVDVTLTKYLTTTIYGVAYYFKPASTALQFQYSATIGLAYTFKNK